jgi:glutaredoxin
MATSEKDLVLYVKNLCPYCRKVTTFMDHNGIDIPIKDVYSDVDAMVELVTIGGKNQAPCLFIDGKPLYESDDIIAFLAEEFAV